MALELLTPALCAAQPALWQTLSQQVGQQAFADPAIEVILARPMQRWSGLPLIDKIRPTDMLGLYEMNLGTDVFYSDAHDNYLIRGELETRNQRNLAASGSNR